ncbi:MAG: FeoA family protein [Candidatus Promineifilaceae bacterium]
MISLILGSEMDKNVLTLDQLQKGQQAIVTGVKSYGPERRRLMDLGILPGTKICVEMGNPLGDPIAYLIRDSIIALRQTQAQNVEISIQEENQ